MKKLSKEKQKGIALFLTLAILTLLSIIGFGMVAIARTNSRTIVSQTGADKAYYLALAGISRAKDELRKDSWWGTSSELLFSVDEGYYKVSVWAPSSNTTASRKKWKVTSTGSTDDFNRKLVTWFEEESFADYSYFTETENVGTYNFWLTGSDIIKGRVHTNGYFNIYKTPQFDDRVTSHNRYDNYYDPAGRLYTRGSEVTGDASKFYHYYYSYDYDKPEALEDNKDFSFDGGWSELQMPDDTGKIADHADKIIYQDVDLTFLDSGNVQVKTKITPSYWVRERRDGRWVWVPRQAEQSETFLLPTDDLTLYVGGTVNIKGGKVKGKVTISSQNNTYIEDSIIYSDKNRDTLGIVSERDIILKTSPEVQKDIEIDAALMAIYGSFYTDQYYTGIKRGKLKVYGGVMQYYRGPVGTFNAFTGATITGYEKDYEYDKKLKDTPPPDFPTTGNLRIMSVMDSGAVGN